jgi:hypothetical protein
LNATSRRQSFELWRFRHRDIEIAAADYSAHPHKSLHRQAQRSDLLAEGLFLGLHSFLAGQFLGDLAVALSALPEPFSDAP